MRFVFQVCMSDLYVGCYVMFVCQVCKPGLYVRFECWFCMQV